MVSTILRLKRLLNKEKLANESKRQYLLVSNLGCASPAWCHYEL